MAKSEEESQDRLVAKDAAFPSIIMMPGQTAVSRRGFLVLGALSGAALVAAACGQAVQSLTPGQSQSAPGQPSSSTAPSAQPSASPSPAAATPKVGGTLRVGAVKPSTSFDPLTMADAAPIMSIQQVVEYLVMVGPDNNVVPSLAESWTPDSTAKNWTFNIRKNVQFNNGQPLTADDVVASFERVLDPAANSGALTALTGLLSKGHTERVDDHTVIFHLDSSFVDFPYMISPANYNAVILPKNYDGKWSANPVGTGPYEMTNYAPTQSVSLKKRAGYWGTAPYVDDIEITFFDDSKAEALAIQGGSIDIAIDVDASLYKDQTLVLVEGKSSGYYSLNMRVDRTPFTDKRVRQAVAYCLDRPALIQGVLQGKGLVANDHHWAPVYPVQPIGISQRSQDYAKAKQLLSDAGMPNGFSATLTVDDEPGVPDYAVLIKQMCAPAGIDLKIAQMPSAQFYGSGNDQPWLQADMTVVTWGGRPVPEQAIQASTVCGAVWNSAHYCNKDFDKLMQQYAATLDQSTRVSLASQAAAIEWDEVPAVISFFNNFLQCTTTKVHGLAPTVVGNIVLTGVWLDA